MATTDNLAIIEVAPNQDQKETTINNGLNQLDNATQGFLAISFTANARTLTATEFTNHLDFQLGALTATGTLTIPNTKRMFVVDNRTSGFSCTVTNGSGATVVVPSGVMTILRNNGTDVVAPTSLLTSAGVTSVVGTGEIVASPTVGAVTLSLGTIASGHLIANTSTVTAAPGDASLSALLDLDFGSVEGDVIYRGATAWAALVAGTSGEFLQTQGTAAPPQWAAVSGGGGGTVTDVVTSGAGISGGPITSTGTLTVEWNAGAVTAIGSNLALTSGTLSGTAGGGSVTSVVAGSGLNGGTITSSGTLTANWNGGTVTALGDGVGLNSGTIQTDHQGTIALIGTTTGTITPAEGVTSEIVNVGTAAGTIAVASGLYNGQHLRLEIIQGATAQTVGFDSTVAFGSDITSFTATATAAARDLVQLVWNGTKWMFVAVNHGF